MSKTTALTAGVFVKVSTQFRADISAINKSIYFFNYRIDIENRNPFEVQLLHRDWFIFDSLNEKSHVSGAGVVGQLPVIAPNEQYQYTSGCEIHSEYGTMSGFYTFKNMLTGELFKVDIPEFVLIYPGVLN
ncbi:MAG TPA: Co2+/Mg2+ efflux protein ApaG [Fluviicola sp.]|nr:Co2+/Mg2+ efflux protein ApaG [Fluviicola sp.]